MGCVGLLIWWKAVSWNWVCLLPDEFNWPTHCNSTIMSIKRSDNLRLEGIPSSAPGSGWKKWNIQLHFQMPCLRHQLASNIQISPKTSTLLRVGRICVSSRTIALMLALRNPQGCRGKKLGPSFSEVVSAQPRCEAQHQGLNLLCLWVMQVQFSVSGWEEYY